MHTLCIPRHIKDTLCSQIPCSLKWIQDFQVSFRVFLEPLFTPRPLPNVNASHTSSKPHHNLYLKQNQTPLTYFYFKQGVRLLASNPFVNIVASLFRIELLPLPGFILMRLTYGQIPKMKQSLELEREDTSQRCLYFVIQGFTSDRTMVYLRLN